MADIAYPNLLAGGVTLYVLPTSTQLYAGEGKNVTDQIQNGATALGQFVPYVLSAAGVASAWDGVIANGQPVGFTAQPIPANGKGPAFVSGVFNHEALSWPAAVDTIGERKAAFAGTPIGVRHLL